MANALGSCDNQFMSVCPSVCHTHQHLFLKTSVLSSVYLCRTRPHFTQNAMCINISTPWCLQRLSIIWQHLEALWGYRSGVPPPFRPSEPAHCGSCPLVTPYYCRLGDLLCFMYVYRYSSLILSMYVCFVLFPLFDLSFVDFPSVLRYCWLGLLTCKNHLPYNLYCVGGDVKHCTIQWTHYMTGLTNC